MPVGDRACVRRRISDLAFDKGARTAEKALRHPACREPRMHLLDASMWWGSAGGIRRVIAAKHHWLHSFGWRHSIVVPGAADEGVHAVPGLRLPGSGGYQLVWRRALAARTMQALRPDVIEAADAWTMAWAALDAARHLRVPAVAYCHSHLPSMAAQLGGAALGAVAERAARAWLLRLYARFDLVLAPSRWVVDDLRELGLAQAELQPLGVDCKHFTPAQRDMRWRAQWLASHGLDPRTRVLLYAGRFAPEKHLDVLADAVRRLGPGHLLVALGDGPLPPRGAQVLTLPPQRHPARVARWMASADVFVHAGDRETFGLAVLEAMACGTPVVASARGGSAELARDAALLVGRTDPAVWAEAVHEQLQRPSQAARAAGLAVARRHGWPQLLGPWLQRYGALVAQHLQGERPGRPTAPAAAASP